LFFEVNIYQEDAVNKHHWRATIARPATDIDLQQRSNSEKDDFASVHGNTRDQRLQFVKYCLQKVLPEICQPFIGPLENLTVLDSLNSHLDLGLNLSSAWEETLIPPKIGSFVLNVGCPPRPSSPTSQRQRSITQTLSSLAYTAIETHITGPKGSRDDLIRILESMGDISRSTQDSEQVIYGMLRHCINVVQSGPDGEYESETASFNLNTLRIGNNSEIIAEPEDGASPETDNFVFSRDDRICFSPEFDDGPGSPKDFTACNLEDCGYCGHCDY
jgi:hypothetical protein